MNYELNASSAPTAPFDPSTGHQKLARMSGSWDGPTLTWLDPSAPPDESRTRARIDPLLGARFIRMDYHAKVEGNPHAGQMIFGFDPGQDRYSMVWIDSFHTGTTPMVSIGELRPDGAIHFLGSYGPEAQKWGWRTVIRQDDDNHLLLEAFNISPDGREDRAIETRLTRRAEG
jgi:hypothetical protein